jgi:anaerobic sulfite reductase subunit A
LYSVELSDIASRRSSTWWLLSRLVIEQPLDPWLAELETVLAAVDTDSQVPLGSESGAVYGALRLARSQADGLTALAVDRTNLLAGVMHKGTVSAPYESAFLGTAMNSDQVIDVTQCYQEAGLEEFSLELGPPDYLGSELRFMAFLAFQEMQAYKAGDAGLAAQWQLRERYFLDEHVLNWVPAHCELLSGIAKTPFYAAVAQLIGKACLLDRSDLAQMSNRLSQGLPDGAPALEAGV